jgi:biopolymer transport protein ExbB
MLPLLLLADNVFVKFVTEEWYFAVVLFGMTLIAGVLVAWRLWLNLGSRTDMNVFMPRFQEVLAKEGIDGAMRFCKAAPPTEHIPSKLFVAALENARGGVSAMRRAMSHAVEFEILPDLNFLLPSILAIAKTATMIGLLFTIISMIGTFAELGAAGSGGQAQASSKIGLALFATMFGLLTAIPLVFTHTLCKAWIHKYELKMRNLGNKLILLVQAAKAGTLTAPQPAQAAPVARTAVPAGR